MSYDFQLLPRTRVAEFLARFEEQTAEDDLEINPGPVVAEREAWKAKVLAAVIAAEPRFEPFQFGFSEIAEMYGISESQARVRYRHVELNLPEDDPTGIQIILSDDTASLTVPYWHTGTAAKSVFEQIWSYMSVLEVAGDLATHDPQLGRVIELRNDFEEVLARYLGVSTRLPEIIAQSNRAKKPWWKFW
jgi:hypothetical protein